MMQTYRVCLAGEQDGIIYGVKEFEARSAADADRVAREICRLSWEGQRLTIRISPEAHCPDSGM